MSGQKLSSEDKHEQRGDSQIHVDPINVDPYQQPTWVQSSCPLENDRYSTDSFSRAQITGEKLIPHSAPLGVSTFMKLVPPVSILLLLIFALLGGGHVFEDIVSARTTQPQQLQINQAAHVIIQDARGQIRIHGSHGTSITVFSAQGASSGEIQSNVTAIDARVVDDGNVVLIDALQSDGTPLQAGQEADLDVTVPAMMSLQVLAPQGAVSIASMSGGMHIESRDSINAEQVSGVHGPVVFKSQDGSITVDHVSGQVECVAPQGDIEIHNGHLFGQSRMHTDTGKLVFSGDFDPDGVYRFETQSGMIAISLPQLTSFDLHLFADPSLVSNAFDGALLGPLPRAQLGIATLTGIVEIKQDH